MEQHTHDIDPAGKCSATNEVDDRVSLHWQNLSDAAVGSVTVPN